MINNFLLITIPASIGPVLQHLLPAPLLKRVLIPFIILGMAILMIIQQFWQDPKESVGKFDLDAVSP